MPGWRDISIGFHSDDGKLFFSQNHGNYYGPKFKEGYVVGFCLDGITQNIFFTVNGKKLESKSFYYNIFKKQSNNFNSNTDINAPLDYSDELLYPCIALRKNDSKILINFRKMKFHFKIENYKKKIYNFLIKEIILEIKIDKNESKLIIDNEFPTINEIINDNENSNNFKKSKNGLYQL